jgi:DNA-3-methyladenine glycosylase II
MITSLRVTACRPKHDRRSRKEIITAFLAIGQLLSTKAANSIFFSLSKSLEIASSNIGACSEEELPTIGLSRSKVAYCRSLAVAILEEKISLELFDKLSEAAIAYQLLQIKGIGKWTVEIFLLFCLHQLDVLPANDLAIQLA